MLIKDVCVYLFCVWLWKCTHVCVYSRVGMANTVLKIRFTSDFFWAPSFIQQKWQIAFMYVCMYVQLDARLVRFRFDFSFVFGNFCFDNWAYDFWYHQYWNLFSINRMYMLNKNAFACMYICMYVYAHTIGIIGLILKDFLSF